MFLAYNHPARLEGDAPCQVLCKFTTQVLANLYAPFNLQPIGTNKASPDEDESETGLSQRDTAGGWETRGTDGFLQHSAVLIQPVCCMQTATKHMR